MKIQPKKMYTHEERTDFFARTAHIRTITNVRFLIGNVGKCVRENLCIERMSSARGISSVRSVRVRACVHVCIYAIVYIIPTFAHRVTSIGNRSRTVKACRTIKRKMLKTLSMAIKKSLL